MPRARMALCIWQAYLLETDLVGGACEGLAFFSAEGGTVEGVALLLGAGSASEIT